MAIFKLAEAPNLIYYQDFVTPETECFYCRKPLAEHENSEIIVHWMGSENLFLHADCAQKLATRLATEGFLAERSMNKGGGYPHNKILTGDLE